MNFRKPLFWTLGGEATCLERIFSTVWEFLNLQPKYLS